VITTSVDLLDASNTVLALHPRIAGFDAGTLDAADGTFAIAAFNVQGAPLMIEQASVHLMPRLASIDAMVPGVTQMFDPFKQPIQDRSTKRADIKRVVMKESGQISIPIARLRDGRNIVERIGQRECEGADIRGELRDTFGCKTGVNVDLFPATSILLTATIVAPNEKHWEIKRKSYVIGPVRTQVFYQLAGRHPDLNKNGIDDTIEILTGRAKDGNKDGVIDEVQRRR
jgi:hypothetical protein